MVAAADRVQEIVGPLVQALGVDLEGVSVQPAGRRRLVQILIDRDGGITLDEVAEVSRSVSAALDDDGTFGDEPYVLDVGSPGVDRPLTLPRHWRRSTGRLVRIVRRSGETLLGRVRQADDTGATVLVDGSEVVVALADVASAVVQVELNRIDEEG